MELEGVARGYTKELFIKLIINMLDELEIQELYKYMQIAQMCYQYVGSIGSNKYNTFIKDFSSDNIIKFRTWINVYCINSTFADSDRREFWTKYAVYCQNEYRSKQKILVMKFQQHIIVEFETMGPIYIYDKLYFEKYMNDFYYYGSSESKMRYILLHKSSFFRRLEHRGFWQNDVSYALRNHVLTGRIE